MVSEIRNVDLSSDMFNIRIMGNAVSMNYVYKFVWSHAMRFIKNSKYKRSDCAMYWRSEMEQ